MRFGERGIVAAERNQSRSSLLSEPPACARCWLPAAGVHAAVASLRQRVRPNCPGLARLTTLVVRLTVMTALEEWTLRLVLVRSETVDLPAFCNLIAETRERDPLGEAYRVVSGDHEMIKYLAVHQR